jgi:hypothetical protein
MIERGVLVDDFEDEEEGQSEDDSNVSGGAASPDDKKTKQASKPALQANNQNAFGTLGATAGGPSALALNQPLVAGAVDYSKILVAGEGYGREFLKNEIDRLIKMLQDKQ